MTNNLPLGWCECELGDIFKTSSGGTPKRTEKAYYNGNIPWLKSGELNNSIIYSAEEFITQKGVDSSSAKLFPKGSVLLALYGATVGKLGILDFDSTTNQAICCIFQTEFYKQYFLFYYLAYKKDFLISQGKGGAQPNINQEIVKALTIPYPPLNEQKRIVGRIEEVFADIDDGVHSLKLAQSQIKQYKQSVLKSAFNNNGIIKKIGEICNVVRGGSPRPAGSELYYNGDIPFMKVADLTKDENMYVFEAQYSIKEAGLKKTRLVNENTLLLSNSGATLGVPKITAIKTTFNDGVAAFLGLSDKEIKYHYYFWKSKTKELRTINQGAAQPNLNTNIIKDISIPLPSLPEQEKIVEEIEKRFEVADNLLKQVQDGLENAKKLKQSILKKAFLGKLVPQNPNDEPASELLKRIKAQNTKIKKGKK